jgi:hypothetical protein
MFGFFQHPMAKTSDGIKNRPFFMEIMIFGREFSAIVRQLHQKSAGLTKSWGGFK